MQTSSFDRSQIIPGDSHFCYYQNMNEVGQLQKLVNLIMTIKKGDIDEMQHILSDNPSAVVNRFYTDPQERFPPLHFAAVFPNQERGMEMVKLLIQKGADPNYRDSYSQTVLYYLSRDGHAHIARYLLDKYHLNTNNLDGLQQQTPIFYAAREGHCNMIQALADYGANVNHKDNNSQTCLFYAARDGRLDACKLLVTLGMEVWHQDKKKRNALSFAKQRSQKSVVDFLNSLKQDEKKGREIEKVKVQRESSHNEKKKMKKDAPKSQYAIIFTNHAGAVHQLDETELEQFKRRHEKLYNLIENPDLLAQQSANNSAYQQRSRFLKIANKILNALWKSKFGYLFLKPVDPIELNIPDYFNIVKRPMDFGTIKTKLQNNAYENHNNFVEDVLLVLDNCILYNGTENSVGKAALELKLDANALFTEFYQL